MKWDRHELEFGKRTFLMGIVNVTDDSFSKDGLAHDLDKAVENIFQAEEDGADIIDIGAESSRPGAIPIDEKTEIKRLSYVLQKVKDRLKIPVSVDTYKPNVILEVLEIGSFLINDITGLKNIENREIIAENNVPVIIMHMQGVPQTMQKDPKYNDVVADIISFLKRQIDLAVESDIDREKIIIDPGIGFGKTLEHNLEILNRLEEFKMLDCPILIGTSRKSFIGTILSKEVHEREFGTAASVAIAIKNGADIVRVHNTKDMKDVALISDAIVRS